MERLNTSSDTEGDIINPEIPQTPEERWELLQLCIAAIKRGNAVVGYTALHGSVDGVRELERHRRGAHERNSGI